MNGVALLEKLLTREMKLNLKKVRANAVETYLFYQNVVKYSNVTDCIKENRKQTQKLGDEFNENLIKLSVYNHFLHIFIYGKFLIFEI